MRYRLRTLLIVLAAGPPLLSFGYQEFRRYQFRQSIIALEQSLNSPNAYMSKDEWRRLISEGVKVRCGDLGKE